jgi:hypothetical protein
LRNKTHDKLDKGCIRREVRRLLFIYQCQVALWEDLTQRRAFLLQKLVASMFLQKTLLPSREKTLKDKSIHLNLIRETQARMLVLLRGQTKTQLSKNMTPEIMSLEMPANWFVSYNNFFFDVDVEEGKNGYVRSDINLGFQNGLMHIKYFDKTGQENGIRLKDYAIDLVWYPDSKINGSYTFAVLDTNLNWDNEKLVFQSKDRYAIQKSINFCLFYIAQHKTISPSFEKIFENTKEAFNNKFPRLMPLKIHAHIAVFHNHFYDQPLDDSSFVKKEAKEGLLLKLKQGRTQSEPHFHWVFNTYELTLKWLYSPQAGYSYVMKFSYEPQQEVMLEYQHKNRYVMQTLINYCIETISVVGYGYDFEQKALQLLKEVHGDEINV